MQHMYSVYTGAVSKVHIHALGSKHWAANQLLVRPLLCPLRLWHHIACLLAKTRACLCDHKAYLLTKPHAFLCDYTACLLVKRHVLLCNHLLATWISIMMLLKLKAKARAPSALKTPQTLSAWPMSATGMPPAVPVGWLSSAHTRTHQG